VKEIAKCIYRHPIPQKYKHSFAYLAQPFYLWVSKNGLAKNWQEVHPHASDLLTIH